MMTRDDCILATRLGNPNAHWTRPPRPRQRANWAKPTEFAPYRCEGSRQAPRQRSRGVCLDAVSGPPRPRRHETSLSCPRSPLHRLRAQLQPIDRAQWDMRAPGSLGDAGPAAHGPARGRLGLRLPGPGDHQVLPLFRGQDRHRLSPQGERLPPGRRRGDHHAPREGRQATDDRAPLRRGRGDRRVHREGRAQEGTALPGPAKLSRPSSATST